jgi:hypothetical protein
MILAQLHVLQMPLRFIKVALEHWIPAQHAWVLLNAIARNNSQMKIATVVQLN